MTKPTPVGPYDLIDHRERVTKPTPAQIKAAFKALKEIADMRYDNTSASTIAYRAITAAAEVGDDPDAWWTSPKDRITPEQDSIAMLEAAAEVGEPLTDYTQWDKIVTERDTLRKQVAAERERCAQVAEEPKDIYGIGSEIAAAIRALKDK